MPKILYLLGHLGLGDTIILCGMVRVLAEQYDRIILPCKWPNRPTVTVMFSDLENVMILPVENDMDAVRWGERCKIGKTRVLKLGCFAGPINPVGWDRQFYEQAGVPFIARWDSFKLPIKLDSEIPHYRPFLHEDTVRGFLINRDKVPRHAVPVGRTKVMFDSLHWLQYAPEIHCIDSSWLCLADSVPTQATRLVVHKYARKNGLMPTLKKNWEIVT